MIGINRLKRFCFVTLRVFKYSWLSTCKNVKKGKVVLSHPLLMQGKGKIIIGDNFHNGIKGSANYYSHYNFLEARHENSEIVIGENVVFNNAISIVAESKIVIEDFVMIGINTSIIDSDGHDLNPEKRRNTAPAMAEIVLKKNVLIYPNVIIMKGVTIGENSVIGSGSIVTKSIPDNVFAAGNPAKVIRQL